MREIINNLKQNFGFIKYSHNIFIYALSVMIPSIDIFLYFAILERKYINNKLKSATCIKFFLY